MSPGLIRKAWVKKVHVFVAGVGPTSSSSSLGGHPAQGGHDAAEALTQLQGGVAGQPGRVVEAFHLRGAVQQLGEEVCELLLKVSWKQRDRGWINSCGRIRSLNTKVPREIFTEFYHTKLESMFHI